VSCFTLAIFFGEKLSPEYRQSVTPSRDRKFESISLQQGVCKLSVPRALGGHRRPERRPIRASSGCSAGGWIVASAATIWAGLAGIDAGGGCTDSARRALGGNRLSSARLAGRSPRPARL
jgi:hypothetical protein